MHLRRILLAFSLATSAASVAFADLVQLNDSSTDSLEQLTRTLSQGAYSDSSDIDLPAETKLNVQLREKSIELNNDTIAKKYGNSSINKSSYNAMSTGGAYSWLVSHPLPDMKRVSSDFGGRTMGGRAENHSGLDLSAPSGTPIYATGPGIVTKSGWGTGYGQYVEINHGNGYLTRYAHASRLVARVGDRVQAGELIANVGCTGRCTGPHLHYEVVKDGQRKNPSTYLAMLP
ncbi:M23 family metallopeptidase [Acinetobacter cumulans]|jgi:murein DD-endopeptidase MepM/ murein hydrolase activator NlpD|uniref:M23 family metallopeptidase n=1 Tax=Acinetobacter cumulans TaxID=2136182 RepID=A0A498CYN8_9GAMM|nr:M23 family metallopeptidase [Acinetobacter cumulans]RLL37018.1 M23 family metallopeptidase [Acinetobacter cumulans]